MYAEKSGVTWTTLLSLCVCGLTASLPAHADLSYGGFNYNDATFQRHMEVARGRIKVNCKDCDGKGLVNYYCFGCHDGVTVGTTMIDRGAKIAPSSTYGEWVVRVERMSFMGCDIPPELIPEMASYLESLQKSPEAQAAMAAQAAAAAAHAATAAPGQVDVENYCTGCHEGLTVGTTKIGGGSIKAPSRTYEEWVATINRMSLRFPGSGAHIPPELIPTMAAYLDSLDQKNKAPRTGNKKAKYSKPKATTPNPSK
ncbi:MAG: hypothetical protein Q7S51_10705 [Gallionellaceae bacterium]|nr:hypothetical protein [Gallionellaceae bacterium]